MSTAGGRIQRLVRGRRRAWSAALSLVLVACAGLAIVSLLPGRAQSRSRGARRDTATVAEALRGKSAVAHALRGKITLAQAPAGLRAAVERDTRLSVDSAKSWSLHASYGTGSVRLTGPGWSARVGLGSVGRNAALAPVSGVVSHGALDALYGRSGVSESFTSGPLGVIQTFEVAKRPSGTGQLRLEFDIAGLRATGSGRRLNLRGARGQVVASYRYLRVTDARGRVVKASMRPSANGREIVLDVADSQAQYPLRIEPMFAVRNGSKLALAAGATRSGLRASYGPASVRLSGPKLSGTVGLGEVGRAGALNPVSGALKRGSGAALYRGSGITETFTDRLLGVEQSFHIAQRPSGSGPLLLRVGLSGLTASGSGTTLALHSASGTTVGAYSGLRVTDADGRAVKASMSPGPDGRGIVISVDDRSARYPLLVDPTFTLIGEVNGPAPNDAFGSAVSISGSTALVGAPDEANGGKAFIFTLSGGTWTNTATLTVPASAPAGTSGFGEAVAISGSTAVVSAGSGAVGAVYVYTLSGGTWNYTTGLTASDGVSGDEFGISVATSGSTIAVGAPYHAVNDNGYVGATYIYTLSAGTWSQTAELAPADSNEFDYSGSSVAISESGATVVAGAVSGGDDPSAYVFTLSGGSWSQAAELITPFTTSSINLTAAVAISGSTIVVGGSEYANGDAGIAYVYTNPGSGWGPSPTATLTPADSGGFFGTAVAISGNTIVVGAFGHNAGHYGDQGAAYVFTGSGASWTQQPTDLLDPNGTGGDEFGARVAVSGSAILVGNLSNNGGTTHAFFFSSVQLGPTFTVTNTSDTNDGACYFGDCSLRDAITAANAYPTADGEPTIAFDLPAGVQTISPATPLPAITNAMKIDGTTDPGYPGSFAQPDFPATVDSPLVDIDGSSCTASCDGLDVSAEEVTIEGLAIEDFPEAGIVLTGGGQNTITKDWIGENPATQALDGNAYYGIEISASANNVIDNDLVAGNGGGLLTYSDGANIEITGSSYFNIVSSDDLTGDPNGPTSGRDSQGVVIGYGPADNTIGGLGPDNDVINGYIDNGVELNNALSGNAIQGDAIGITGGPHPHLLGDGGQGTGIEVAYTSGTVIGDGAAPGTQANTARGNEIDGNTQSGSVGIAVNDDSSDTTIAGNYIGTDSAGDSGLGNFEGVAVGFGSSTANVIGPGNTIADNTGTSVNGASGVELDGPGNEVTANSIYGNSGPGIGGYYASVPTPPTLTANSTQDGSATAINGTVTGTAGSSVAVDVFDSPACGNGQGETYLGTQDVTIGSGGTATFSVASAEPSAGDSITATETTALAGQTSPSTSGFSGCSTVISTGDNDEWTNAQLITPNASGAGSATGSIDLSGQARWYKVPISPGGSVSVNLSNLPADYNLALFSDIGQAEASLTSNDSDEPTTENLQALQAEQPGNAFSPSVFSPSVFSPSVFSPSVFSPSVFSPSVFSPSVFSPSVFSPSVFSPSVFSPSVFSPSVVSPSVFSPSVFSPSVFSPSVFSPSTPIVDAEDYQDAQIESLLAVSDTGGDANQQVSADTWNNTGYFYIRVSGANGAYAPGQDFSLGVQVNSGTCGGVSSSSAPLLSSSVPVGSGSGYKTLILTDESRMTNDGDLANMQSDLTTFAGESSVDGTVVDVGTDSPQVEALQTQADQNADCAEAQNLVAGAIQQIVGTVRKANPGLKYIVIIGDDHVIPFFRYPDTSGLAAESGYVPPVLDTSASYASLESDDFLSDDAYGSSTVLSAGGQDIPVPDLPVGRLVTTPTQIDDMLQAYLSTPNGDGVISTPTSSLVTGYDFMTASADAVENNFKAGLGSGATNDTLITNDGVAPSNTGNPPTQSWTATQLESALLGKRHDLIYLAGHFSANNTLAADDSTTMNATQLASSNVNLQNSIVFSPGCHSGYNIASEDAVPGVTQTTDWVGAFAQHGATLIAGTGYQYGDTDFLAYSDQLYADFSQQLLVGSGPVAVGSALTAAKSTYLDDTPDLQGIDIKSVLEATLYGLPMISVNMPDGRTAAPTSTSTVSSTTPAAAGSPGATLGLSSSDLTLTPSVTSNSVPLESPTGGTAPTATYLSGPNGVDVNPAEPTLPLSVSDVSVPGQVLRGVGFTGGTYTDQSGITPLTGAPTTDLSSVHSTFSSSTFFPSQLFTVNYFGGLNGGPASTKLMLTPAQYESDAPGSLTDTQRSYSSVGVRLFYSDNTQTYGSNTPALAAPPSIGEISATASGGTVTFQAHVVGDPSAGVQQVWVTYTGVDTPSAGTGEWESLYLTQDSTDSTLWSGTLSGLSAAQINNMQFIVQAVNGVGLVGIDDNDGSYFQPNQIAPELQTGAQALTPTTLSLNSPPSSGNYGSTVSVNATLSDGSGPVASQLVSFTIGDSTVDGKTNSAGTATAQIPLEDLPGGSYQLSASYDGSATLAGTSVSTSTFAVNKLATTLTLSGPSSLNPGTSPTGITATLQSGGVGLSNYSVEFELTPTGQTSGTAVIETALTSLTGVAQLPSVAALTTGGTYSVSAFFGSGGPLSPPPDPIFANTVATSQPLTINGQAPAFTSVASATFTVGSAGSFPVTTTGVPANTIALGTGTGCAKLPTGVTLSGTGNTATLAGTPAAGTGGSYAICLTASNGVGTAATQAFTLKVDQAPAFTSLAAATFTVGSAGSFPVTTSGYPAATVSVGTGSGCVALPKGLSLSGTGTLSGTPAAGTGGSYAICLSASNGVGTAATQAFTLTVNQATQAPAFTSVASATFTVGSAGSFPVTTTGVPANTIALGTGTGCAKLPTGVTLSGTGNTATLAGTPAAGTGGSYAICLTASNGVGTAATQAFTLKVDQAPAFTSLAAATFTVGSAGSFPVTTSGYPAATVSVGTGSGCVALPKGLSLSGTGTLSGTPAAGTGGSYAICLSASNGVGTAATQAFTLTITTGLSSGTTACNGTYGGSGTTVTVASGAVCTLLPGAHVSGNVQVNPGGELNAQDVSIGGSLVATGAKWIEVGGGGTIGGSLLVTATSGSPTGSDDKLCDESISGSVSLLLSGPGAPFDIGNLGACSGGPGLNVGGSVLVGLNTAPVTVGGNTIKGALVVDANLAKLTIASNTVGGAIQVYSNILGVGGTLVGNSSGVSCQLQGDKPTIAGSKNTAPAKAPNSCNASA